MGGRHRKYRDLNIEVLRPRSAESCLHVKRSYLDKIYSLQQHGEETLAGSKRSSQTFGRDATACAFLELQVCYYAPDSEVKDVFG